MWFNTLEALERFDEGIAKQISVSPEEIEKFRQELAATPAATLIKVWFGERSSGKTGKLDVLLRKRLRTRAALLSWIHGPGASIARDLLYVKLPSSDKRRLVNLLRASVRSKMPWMDSRLIHAMAFRPDEVDCLAAKTVGETKGFQPWGPLYRGVKIGKRKGYRQLWIPNPPLKATQGALLRLIGPGLSRALRPFVYGVSSDCSGPTFENAAAHVGMAYVATFDIRDFFPSTSVGDVIRGLQWAADGDHLMFDAARTPSYLKANPQVKSLHWTDDARVLVARLATRRARLPQGSPLSPLLANIAFARFDEQILKALACQFGKRQFKYTRYFDDLTISVTAKAAHGLDLDQTSAVRDCISQKLQEILRESSYSLNEDKSRCTKLSALDDAALTEADVNCGGHHVTGVVVRRDSVELTRDLKRELRATIHRLRQRDFVEDARIWHQGKKLPSPAFQSLSKGHRWEKSKTIMRRCSAERLAVLMLRHFHPELRVKAILRQWYPWQERFIGGTDVRQGKQAWPLVEWLLAALWQGTVTARRQSDNSIRFSQGGVDVCDVEAESALHFFRLPKDAAIAASEYWHYLRGMQGFLGACPNRHEFSEIIEWRTRLDDAMSTIEIKAPEIVAETVEVESSEPLTVPECVRALSAKLQREYREFARRIEAPMNSSLAAAEAAVREVATNAEEFDRWIAGLRGLFVRRLPLLPAVVARAGNFEHGYLFKALRVWDDGARRLVARDYECITVLRKELKIDPIVKEDESQFAKAQEKVLRWLLAYLERSTEIRGEGDGGKPDLDWRKHLPTNPWHGTLKERLTDAINELTQAHESLRSTASEGKLFIRDSGEDLIHDRETLQCSEHRNSDEAWKHLGEVAKVICKECQEAVEPDLWRERVESKGPLAAQADERRKKVWRRIRDGIGVELRERAFVLEMLRNRSAHRASHERRLEWCKLQARVASILGREWESISGKDHSQFDAADDLELIGHEATIVKLELIRSLTELFREVHAKQAWRP